MGPTTWGRWERSQGAFLTDLEKAVPNRTPTFSSSLSPTFPWLYFLWTTFFLTTVLFFSVLGFCDFFLDWHVFASSDWDEEEKRTFESNLVPFVLVWSCLMHSSLSSISFVRKRKKIAKFLNFWNQAVDEMNISVPKKIRHYALVNHLVFLGFLVVIFIAYKILYLQLVRGGALLVGILTFRPVIFLFDVREDLFRVRIFGLSVILYAVYASRAFLLLFSFKSILLSHAFKMWNQRFKIFLSSTTIKGKHNPMGEKEEEKMCKKLFKDYTILLKLVKLSDDVFGVVLQSYYGSQLMNMCFELYFLARSGTYNKSWMEVMGALVVLLQNLYIFFTVSLDAANVNEEAAKGADLLKKAGLGFEQTAPKKCLISSMRFIFSQKIVLTGGKYFAVDRPFIIHVLGAVFTYFIVTLQYGPSLHKKLEEGVLSPEI